MPSLTQEEAAVRAGLLTVREYDVHLDLTGALERTDFAATTTVRFSCTEPGATSFIELRPTAIHEIQLNGEPVDPASIEDDRIVLAALRADNELTVRATMAYSSTGEGLHRYVDPADGQVYLYAQSAMDDAQRIFACFDQPDLKARLRLRVDAPAGWTVWANGAATGDGEFARTPLMSTYLFTVVAGPYHVRTSEHDGVPLGLACRRSLAAYLDRDAQELFAFTASCLDMYHEMFGIRYPYEKYDQAFVPQFNLQAMENPGCVTFADELLFSSSVTQTEQQMRAVILAHEMAHMWFGDLVTMRWWDDIWLNESFAELMGWWVAARATRFTDAWTNFTIWRKAGGYAADQRSSTHPVAPASVPDVASALLNIDGISYAKGASTLRQLVAWMGEDDFLAGLRSYLTKHSYGNATLTDLLTALSDASGRDLASWAEVWLRRSQVNTLRPEVDVDEAGNYRSVTIVQTAPADYPTLRPHHIGVAGYDASGRTHRVEVDLDPTSDGGRTPVTELVGVHAAQLLLLNDGDLTFAKVRFDPDSQQHLPQLLTSVTDPLARALMWSAAADATRDAEAAPADFITLAAAALPHETEVAVWEEMLRFAVAEVAERYLDGAARVSALDTLAAACERTLLSAKEGSSWQLAAARGWVKAAGPTAIETAAGWLHGAGVPDGLLVDQDLRWMVLSRLVVHGLAGPAQITAESERDRSGEGAEQAARCQAALPDAQAKREAWDIIVSDDATATRIVAATAEGFWHAAQEELTAPFVSRYFAEMPAMAQRRTPAAVIQVARAAYPRFAVSVRTLAEAEEMLSNPELNVGLRRMAVNGTDDLRRAVRVRERFA